MNEPNLKKLEMQGFPLRFTHETRKERKHGFCLFYIKHEKVNNLLPLRVSQIQNGFVTRVPFYPFDEGVP